MPITIPDQAPIRITYTVGVTPTDTFNFPFRVLREEDITVYVDGNAIPVTFSITGTVPTETGVNVVLDVPVDNATVVLLGDIAVQRSVNFPTNGVFPIDTLNEQLNEIFAILQEQESRLDRTLMAAPYSIADYSNLNLPEPEDGFAIAWQGTDGAMQNLDTSSFVGATGPAGADGDPGLNWLSAYNAGTTYATNDGVSYNGSSYISLVDSNTGNTPDVSPTEWDLLAQQGAAGAGTGDMLAANYDPSGYNSAVAFLGEVNTFTETQYFDLTTLTDAASIAWDLDLNQVTEVTLTDNRALAAPTNLRAGATYILFVKQDGAGSRTLSYDATYKFPTGGTPVLSTDPNAVDIITFVCDGTSLYGVGQNNFV